MQTLTCEFCFRIGEGKYWRMGRSATCNRPEEAQSFWQPGRPHPHLAHHSQHQFDKEKEIQETLENRVPSQSSLWTSMNHRSFSKISSDYIVEPSYIYANRSWGTGCGSLSPAASRPFAPRPVPLLAPVAGATSAPRSCIWAAGASGLRPGRSPGPTSTKHCQSTGRRHADANFEVKKLPWQTCRIMTSTSF